jgi:hypothetical protein
MIYLRRGDAGITGDGGTGDWIVQWQTFLTGAGHYQGRLLPTFGPATEAATIRFQGAVGAQEDGIVGGAVTAAAADLGFQAPWLGAPPMLRETDPSWPRPSDLDGDGSADLVYVGSAERERRYGPLQWRPVPGSSSEIVITNDFAATKLCKIHLPQTVGLDCYGSSFRGNITIHKAAAQPLADAFAEIEAAGLQHLLLSWGGSFVPRRIRGSDALSNHAYGLAFDVNMAQNGLGVVPALAGNTGTVRPLVPIFEKHGFYWGGWYRSRKDGMHFEYVGPA